MDFDPSMDLAWWDENTTIGMVEIKSKSNKNNDHNVIKEDNVPSVNNESIGFTKALQTF